MESHDNPRDNKFSQTIHFGIDIGFPYLRYGAKSRWCSDISPLEDSKPFNDHLHDVFEEIAKLRTSYVEQRGKFKDTAELDLYYSTGYYEMTAGLSSFPLGKTTVSNPAGSRGRIGSATNGLGHQGTRLSTDRQKKVVEVLAEQLQRELRDSSGLRDIIRGHHISDMPICEACGSGPPI